MPSDPTRAIVQVDIVSDVVCPWCIVGFRQLDQALTRTGFLANLRWHPFELNPSMPPEGQNLREHITEKYGTTAEQSQQARDRLSALGAELGFTFSFTDDSRMVNTFKAHQLLDWAEEQQLQHPLKMALFEAYFTHGRDVSDAHVLADVAQSVGLDRESATQVLDSGERQQQVREKQGFWTSRGISGVPSMVFGGKYLVTGAQGADTYEQLLRRCVEEAA
ncbi:DsbA family oxidoreductase [Tropicibacter sp. R16_0]|uniref:DsbA family oxidoreductase n=1 Tax=Tropicibacter sp. R16_0 TaxID=2821102 RepID=UPI001ADC66CF|nr:DsbA family oxidoreductase [Tropicibacter sp. R16_0]MBO9450124.1 DsbA family oxidoreductase [Tropicibacter sp. R16_0]